MSNIKIYGEHEPKTLAQMQRCMTVGSAVKGVLCADGHLGYAHPIGGVVAYEEHISISGVGFDIACGNMAVRLDARYADIAPRAKTHPRRHRPRDQLRRRAAQRGEGRSRAVRFAPLGCGRCRRSEEDGAQSARHRRVRQPLCRPLRGRGGLRLDRRALRLARPRTQDYDQASGMGAARKMAWRSIRPSFGADGDIGQSYIAGVELGGLYAYAGREWVVERVRQIIGAAVTDSVHNHHNFAWRETHGERDCGSCARVPPLPSRASAASSAVRWAMTP